MQRFVPSSARRNARTSEGPTFDALEPRQLLAFASYRVNFQPANTPPVAGYAVDSGERFGARASGQQYGWNIDNRDNTRIRNLDPNPLQDTLIHLQRNGDHVWEYALPDGAYEVRLWHGDPAYSDQVDNFQVEDRVFIGGNPGGVGGTVTVKDGRLTVRAGPGASNAKLQYITFATAESTPHPAPSNLQAAALGTSSVKLTWKNNSPAADNFSIERSDSTSSDWKHLANVSSSITTYTDATVTAGFTYKYRVQAQAPAQISSNWSNIATVTVGQVVGFQSADIGSPSSKGSTTVVNPGVDYDITAGGSDVWGTSDQFRFVYKSVTGDFDFSAQVGKFTGGNSASMAGLMARSSLSPNAQNIFMRSSATNSLRTGYRLTNGGSTTGVGSLPVTLPNAYVRLQRIGNVFKTFGSTDGVKWTMVTQQTIDMGSSVYFGMAVSARSASGSSVKASIRKLTDRLGL